MIIVWGRRNSLNVQKVMWVLGELGLSYERRDVAGSFGVTDEYLEKNPAGTVPTIEDGDLTLYESNACVRYLARQYGSGTLCPADPRSAALADQWMEWQTNVFGAAFFPTFFNMVRLPADQASPAAVLQGAARSGALLQGLEQRIQGQPYLAGDTFTMADIPLGTMMYRYFTLDIERPSLPVIESWYARLTERPSYRKHVMIPFGTNPDEWLAEEQRNAGIQ